MRFICDKYHIYTSIILLYCCWGWTRRKNASTKTYYTDNDNDDNDNDDDWKIYKIDNQIKGIYYIIIICFAKVDNNNSNRKSNGETN